MGSEVTEGSFRSGQNYGELPVDAWKGILKTAPVPIQRIALAKIAEHIENVLGFVPYPWIVCALAGIPYRLPRITEHEWTGKIRMMKKRMFRTCDKCGQFDTEAVMKAGCRGERWPFEGVI